MCIGTGIENVCFSNFQQNSKSAMEYVAYAAEADFEKRRLRMREETKVVYRGSNHVFLQIFNRIGGLFTLVTFLNLTSTCLLPIENILLRLILKRED